MPFIQICIFIKCSSCFVILCSEVFRPGGDVNAGAVVCVLCADNTEAVDDRSWSSARWHHDTDTTVSALHGHHCRVQRIRGTDARVYTCTRQLSCNYLQN